MLVMTATCLRPGKRFLLLLAAAGDGACGAPDLRAVGAASSQAPFPPHSRWCLVKRDWAQLEIFHRERHYGLAPQVPCVHHP